MGKEKFSIIVPVYNASCTICKCVDSIQAQTCPDWQLILVNDGSTDNSSHVCRLLAERDTRIIAIDKDNGGPSSARNIGLKAATGEWILFVDSDDYISPDTLLHISDEIGNGATLIIPDTVIEYANGKKTRLSHQETIVPRDYFERLFADFDLGQQSSIGGKCFQAIIIRDNGLEFNEEMRHAEDLIWIYNFLPFCHCVGFTGRPDYHYVFGNPESLTQRFYSFVTEWNGYQQVCKAVEDTIQLFGIKSQKAIENMSRPVITSMVRSLNAIYHSELQSTGKERRGMIRMLNLDYFSRYAPVSHNKKVRFLNFILLKLRSVWIYDLIRTTKARNR